MEKVRAMAEAVVERLRAAVGPMRRNAACIGTINGTSAGAVGQVRPPP
jgi:hypothetical protein